MNLNRKETILFIAQLIPMVGILFLYTDMVGCLFVGENYQVRALYRWEMLLYLTVTTTLYLTGTNILKWPVRQLGYIGYPLYLLSLALCGVFTASHNLLGYKIALLTIPFVAQVIKWYGKGILRRYTRMVQHFAHGHLFNRRGLGIIGATLALLILCIIGIYSLRSTCHIHLRDIITETTTIPYKVPEKPNHNPNLKDRRDPYRNYPRIFNDLNDTQLMAARKNGTTRPLTMEELEVGMFGLQHIETNELYRVDPLTHSAPYLVPKAKSFLDELGEAFQDSLYNRGYDRRHRFIVTSVYRTQNHIKRLRRSGNVNASENSCHQYGTTIDITYMRFDKPVEHIANDMKLQQLLYQTVYDMHKAGRCYVKYERKQACLHITVR